MVKYDLIRRYIIRLARNQADRSGGQRYFRLCRKYKHLQHAFRKVCPTRWGWIFAAPKNSESRGI